MFESFQFYYRQLDHRGATPLLYAICSGSSRDVRELLESGAHREGGHQMAGMEMVAIILRKMQANIQSKLFFKICSVGL